MVSRRFHFVKVLLLVVFVILATASPSLAFGKQNIEVVSYDSSTNEPSSSSDTMANCEQENKALASCKYDDSNFTGCCGLGAEFLCCVKTKQTTTLPSKTQNIVNQLSEVCLEFQRCDACAIKIWTNSVGMFAFVIMLLHMVLA